MNNLSRVTDPTTNRAALDFRRRFAKARLAALDKALGVREPGSERERSLDAERNALRGIKREVERILGPGVPRRPKLPTDLHRQRLVRVLQSEIRSRTESTSWNADRREAEGDHRDARLHRLTLPYAGDEACRELSLDPALLVFVDPPEVAPIEPGGRALLPHAIGVEP